MSCILSTKSGSVESLNVWDRYGCGPKVVQMRRIVVCDSPVAAAIERVEQWVASFAVRRLQSSTGRSHLLRRPHLTVQRALDNLRHLFIRDRAGAAGAVFVGQPLDAVTHKRPAPLAHRVSIHAPPRGDLVARQAFGAEQDHPAAVRKRPRCLVPPHRCIKKATLITAQHHRIRNPASHRITSQVNHYQPTPAASRLECNSRC